MIGLVLLLVVPVMLLYMLFKFLALPIMILLIVWLYGRLHPQAGGHDKHIQRTQYRHFTGHSWAQPGAQPQRKDVTGSAEEHDAQGGAHEQQHWDDF